MTPLSKGGFWPVVDGVNDTAASAMQTLCIVDYEIRFLFSAADQWRAVSTIPVTNGGRCQWYCLPVVGGVNDTADQWWAVFMTLLTCGGGVNDIARQI
jgi:hypothetical protein